MTPAGLVVAAHQLGAGTIEVEDLGLDPLDRADEVGKSLGIETAAARIHGHRSGRGSAQILAVDERLKKVSGKIVDDVPAHVLERVEDMRLSRAGHAGDEQESRQPARLPLGHQNLRPMRSSASATLEGADAVMASIEISGRLTPRKGRSRLSSGSR